MKSRKAHTQARLLRRPGRQRQHDQPRLLPDLRLGHLLPEQRRLRPRLEPRRSGGLPAADEIVYGKRAPSWDRMDPALPRFEAMPPPEETPYAAG
ncbi:MAG: hypothetical protein MI785_01435 [Kiloniellales bacterium]|nr:hypothetical protein [Kiloniellales bacterium]